MSQLSFNILLERELDLIDEIERMIKYGADPSNIVFSHPLKPAKSLKCAKENGVLRLVYDTEQELRKILKHYPDAEVYLRVKPQFTNATIQLSNKFGAAPEDVSGLLKITKELDANFIGIAFHVGSLCDDIETFKVALEYASKIDAEAKELGLNICFIDIGGGFLPPNEKTKFTFQAIAQAINDAIEQYFPDNNIEFIAEPGRFIGSEFMDLYLPVIGTRDHQNKDGSIAQSIYIPDGMYGSFNALTYDHAVPHFEIYSSEEVKDEKKISTTLWGQTCDSADCIYENMEWPKLQIGDMLTIRRFSAYTYSPTSFFNGFHHHKVFFLNKDDDEEAPNAL